MTTYPVSEPEMDQISSLSGQVTARFSAASLLVGLAASIWTNAVFVNEMTPTGQLATYYVAPLLLLFAFGYALAGYLARRKRASTWDKIKSGAEPVRTIAEAGGLMLTETRPAKRGGRS
jgi:peptidoglycan/LPS O-acetylase OafA/YrhL